MKISRTRLALVIILCTTKIAVGQLQVRKELSNESNLKTNMPKHIIQRKNIIYKTIDSINLELDFYKKDDVKNPPLLVWIHGGAWMRGDKQAFLTKNKTLVNKVLNAGYALASVNYRLSSEAIFPAQIQDCNDAINYLVKANNTLGFNKNCIGIMGRSAGGHLAALVATSNAHHITEFFSSEEKPNFKIDVLVDFFGPSDLLHFKENKTPQSPSEPEAKLLGGTPNSKQELARQASPVYYVNKQTPPTILFHGLSDNRVPSKQSEIFKSYLDENEIVNEMCLVENARHGDPIFDTEEYVNKVMLFLKTYFPAK